MEDAIGGDPKRLRRLKALCSYRDGWSVSGVGFADGSRVLRSHSLPHRKKDNTIFSQNGDDNNLFVTQYSGGIKVYDASLYDKDVSGLVPQPDEHALAESIRRSLNRQIWLADLDEPMAMDVQVMKQALERLNDSDAVRKYLRDVEEARKPDMALDTVRFSHPYRIEQNNYGSVYYVLMGEGIFQKGVLECIEMPESSPLIVHAVKFDEQLGVYADPYAREFRLRDLPAEDARLLQTYFAGVLGSLRRADEALAKIA